MKRLEVLYSEAEIAQRVKEIAKEINDYIGDDEAVIVGNLKGAVPFYADIFRCLTGKVRMDFVETQSYVKNQSTGHVKIIRDLSEDIQNKKVVIVEDILDTGLTFEHILKHLKHFHHGGDIKICVLLNKQENRQVDVQADWIGFDIPNKFVIGYGLDDEQYYRNLPYIGYWTK